MSTQAHTPTPFGEESSNSQHDDLLRLIMQELQSLRNEMRDIRRDATNLSNQQREVSPHGSLNVTTPRSNGRFNCSRTTEFHQPPHFDEELHPSPYGGRRGSFEGRGIPRHFEEVPRPQESFEEQVRRAWTPRRVSKLFSTCSISKDPTSEYIGFENWQVFEEVTLLPIVGLTLTSPIGFWMDGLLKTKPITDGLIMSMDGHLPAQSHQEGTSNPTRMNLNGTLRSMQQSIEGLARQFKSVARDIEELKKD
ncbi:hypothetical protein M9H77_30258 [Catharanthus roseus]|uniref:Uncharacterized protein n=1 Tax=Catharanthus roseus TaxID=4058 RepID=A0ACC0A0N3_CATRO|nr:hypothetical protein M9H77_30258 [Catharanthus roseus]